MRKSLTALVALMVAMIGADAARAAVVEPCGVERARLNHVYTYYLSLLVAQTTCDDGATTAAQWYDDLAADRIPEDVFAGGHGRFGSRWNVGEYACRDRRLGSDIGEVWCKTDDGRVVGWTRHRGLTRDGGPRRPYYPSNAPRDWDVQPMPVRVPRLAGRDALRYLRRALRLGFYEAYRYSYARTERCHRLSRTRYRCRVAWIIGDGTYHGVAWVWYARELTAVSWNYAWRITLTDEYCLATGGRRCHTVFRVR